MGKNLRKWVNMGKYGSVHKNPFKSIFMGYSDYLLAAGAKRLTIETQKYRYVLCQSSFLPTWR